MKVAVLGGGFAGLSAAYYARQKGYEVTLFEKEGVFGGLASGFKASNWDWHIERAYHHWFANDHDILDFARGVGFTDILFKDPLTASLYKNQNDGFDFVALDSPIALFSFPYLPIHDRLRAGIILGFLKLSPHLSLYEKQTAKEFLQKNMGNQAYNVLFAELFRKKFGKYAENILASFIWARVNKRTRTLAYPAGGFQGLLNRTELVLREKGAGILTSTTVVAVNKSGNNFELVFSKGTNRAVQREKFDAVISTLPTPITARITRIFPAQFTKNLLKLKYLSAVTCIIQSKDPVLAKAYWLNVTTKELNSMVIIQHTNFMDKQRYGGAHLAYCANYVDEDNTLLKMNNKQIFDFYRQDIKKLNPKLSTGDSKFWVFKGPFAQPIFDQNFLKNKPNYDTPVKNFFIANLDMTYPYDRGTNYAVKVGKYAVGLL